MPKQKVYAYLRVSGQGQLEGHGFKHQLETVSAFCNKSGYDIDQVFRESVSGVADEAERPVFSQMVSEILKDSVDTVIVESVDRLAREYRITEHLLIYLGSICINLIAANTGENVTKAIQSDPIKKALTQIQDIFAELDKSLLVRKLRKAREEKRRVKGKCEGRKGYKDSPHGPELLDAIRKLRRKPRLSGKRRLTYNEVAERLNAQGLRTLTGREFNGNMVRGVLYRAKG